MGFARARPPLSVITTPNLGQLPHNFIGSSRQDDGRKPRSIAVADRLKTSDTRYLVVDAGFRHVVVHDINLRLRKA
jgi:hypothetical protein